jgi:hypothetical protein
MHGETVKFHTNLLENTKTHILCSINFFPQNRAVRKKIWKNIVQPDKPRMTIRRMRFACLITKATYST